MPTGLRSFAPQNTLAEILTTGKSARHLNVSWKSWGGVKRLPPELTSRYPAVDWRGIAGMRDRVSHGYDAIDYGVLWQSVETRVPGLLATVEQMLKDLDSGKKG